MKRTRTKEKLPSEVLPSNVPKSIIKDLDEVWPTASTDKSLFIYGPAGTGKSYKAAAIMFNLMKKYGPAAKYNFYWMNVPEFFFTINQSFDQKGFLENIVNKYSNCLFLVVDDLGTEKTSEWSLQMLYLIINRRYESNLQTIFTCNLDLDRLAEKMKDDRIPSRIMGMSKIMELSGEDRRFNK